MSKPLSSAQLDALLRLAQFWCRGRPQPWHDIRPQTRQALRRAGLADMGITPAGLYALGLTGPAVAEWAKQVRRAAENHDRFRGHLREWWASVPVARDWGGATPLISVAELRAAADALAGYEEAAEEAKRQAVWVEGPARAEVRAALRVEVADG
jgi:hypothetical protein